MGEEHLLYPDLRARGLDQRKAASAKPGETPADTKELYRFWKDCLRSRFNVRMYNEFRSCALDDARRDVPGLFGLKQLQLYYRDILGQGDTPLWGNGKPIPAIFVEHQMEAQNLADSRGAVTNGEPRV